MAGRLLRAPPRPPGRCRNDADTLLLTSALNGARTFARTAVSSKLELFQVRTPCRLPASNANRPLSPHLQIYRVTMTMAMSIVHRITGVALYFGTRAARLVAGRGGERAGLFRLRQRHLRLVDRADRAVRLFSWALIHHMLGGDPAPHLGYRPRPRQAGARHARHRRRWSARSRSRSWCGSIGLLVR